MAISKVVVVDGNNLIVRIDRGVAGRGVTDVEPIEIDGSLYLVFTFSDGTTETIGPVGTIQYIGQTPIVVTGSTISLSTVPVNLGGTGQTTANAGFNALAPTQTGNAGKYLKTDGTNSAWDLLDISTADITGVLPIANGGTNASTASGARTNLGLGTIATQDASAVAITGGSITGITDLAVADGGTGASTAAGAMVNLLPSYTGNANKRLGLDSTASGLEWVTDGGGTVTSVDVSGGTTGLSFTGGPVTTSGTITLSGTLDVDNGGTGATTAAGARTNLNAADQALTLTAGTGLSGGGDLSANRTFSITNTGVTAASYGSASNTLTATVNAQGQLTALAATPIAISNTQISGLGTMSTQNSNAVTITGGSITGITDLAIADGGTGASTASGARSNLGLGTAAVLNAGVANGVATLDAGGTVPLSQIPASIQGGVSYQGSWNAATNTPTLTSSVGSKGYYYVVSTSGSTNLNGVTDWLVGDWAIFNGSVWQKIDNTDQVASVNGYTGVVVLTNTDVGAPPTSLTISAGTGLSGGGNLTTNRTLSIANTAVSAGSYGTASAVPTFTVNGQGQLTAASDVTIAISNTQVSGLGTMSTQNANSVSITGGSITGITDLAIADGGTGASTAGGALTNLGAIGTITSTDGSIVVTPSGTTVDLAVSAASPASTLLTQVRNTTGATLTKGTVVYISGATGQIATVSKAIATGDATSAQTLGMITSDLANNSNGYVTVFGLLENIDTSSYTDGAQLYLSGTTAGAVTATKPSAPTHLVYVAVVEYAHPTQGKLLVKVQNGYELDEIHDVSIVSPTTGQTLVYSASTDLWSNSNAPVISGTTINNTTIGATTASSGAFTTLSASSTVTLSGGTANGVTYLNGSKVLTSGSALTFDGTTFGVSGPIRLTTTSTAPSGNNEFIAYSVNGYTYLTGGASGLILANNSGSDTRIRLEDADNIQFEITSSEAMRLTSTGLGIGTSSPAFKLDLNGVGAVRAGQAIRYYRSDNAIYTELYDAGASGGFTTNNANGDGFRWQNGSSTTVLTLNSSGNLGIGTSSPAYKLHVVSSGNGVNSRFTNGSTIVDVIPTASTSFVGDSGGNNSVGFNTSSNYVAIYTNSTTERLRIDSSGNVGIGTSSPAQLLDVQSATSPTIRISNSKEWASGDSGVIAAYQFYTKDASTPNGTKIAAYINSENYAGSSVPEGILTFGTSAGGGSSTNATEKMRLDSAGNLGLGVTPSAWRTSEYKAVQVGIGASFYGRVTAGDEDKAGFSANSFYDQTDNRWEYIATDFASRYDQTGGGHYWYTAASGSANTAISFTQAMTLGSGGNLLVGVTSGALGSRLEVKSSNTSLAGFTSSDVSGTSYLLTANAGKLNHYATYATSGIDCYHAWWLTASSGAQTQAMTLDASGNLGVGTTSPQLARAHFTTASTYTLNLQNDASNQSGIIFSRNGNGAASSTAIVGNGESTGYLYFLTGGSERARIDSSGTLKVGPNPTVIRSSLFVVGGAFGGGTAAEINNTDSSGGWIPLAFHTAGSLVGYVSSTTTSTAYVTSSDYRLKNTIAPMTGALAKVALLKPCTYKWNLDGSDGEGFIAHELAEVCPDAVSGAKDAVDENGNPKYQGIDTSFLVATLTAAIQEQQAIIESLKARLDAANL